GGRNRRAGATPIRQHRGQGGPDLIDAEMKQSMPGPARKRLLQPRDSLRRQRRFLPRGSEGQHSVRRDDRRQIHDGCVLMLTPNGWPPFGNCKHSTNDTDRLFAGGPQAWLAVGAQLCGYLKMTAVGSDQRPFVALSSMGSVARTEGRAQKSACQRARPGWSVRQSLLPKRKSR